MPTKDDLIRENHELRAKLEFAQAWMRREVATSISRIQEEQSQKSTRVAMKNIFETEWLDILTRKVLWKFDTSLKNAPRYTLERLIDAEIYWNTLQQYPQMDALPIIIAYQKILDAWIEERLVAPWRHREWSTAERSDPGTKNRNSYRLTGFPPAREWQKREWLEQDIVNLIGKKYTLSIGRLYQLLQATRNKELLGRVTREFVHYIDSQGILDTLLSDGFFVPFHSLMEREVFSRKRHESKVTYADARFTRDILIDASEKRGLFEMIF
jgi:hypothetical protein